jgi:hypothetical protein
MAWTASGCATVVEPSEVESMRITFFKGKPGSYETAIWERKITTTKTEVRGLTLAGANTTVTTQGDLGNSPQVTSIGGGGWNVSYTVTTFTGWEDVTP